MSGDNFTRFCTHLAHGHSPLCACVDPGLLPDVSVT
jgi:hypothetical protein